MSDLTDELLFLLIDFGARGASSSETAALGGMAHLVNFKGTDTIEGAIAARIFYNEKMAGFSIPSSEHSTITLWGEDGEIDAFRNMLIQYGGQGKIIACVSDSYNLWRAIKDYWGTTLKSDIMNMGGTLVVRPDSGKPTEVVPKTLKLLGEKFGYRVNSKGYKVLPDYIRVIQGDGVNSDSLVDILVSVVDAGWSVDNLAFGMGGGLLQNVNRDTLGYAMKANAKKNRGENSWISVGKNPVTDSGKRSKFGRQAVIVNANGELESMRLEDCISKGYEDQLRPVWRNGKFLKEYTFEEVRQNAKCE